MARVGLQYCRYCLLDDNDNPTGMGKILAKLLKADMKINIAESIMNADDGIAESIKVFNDGAITFEIDNLSNTVEQDLLGHKLDKDEALVYNEEDISPFVTLGYVVSEMVNKKWRYTVNILKKVQFGDADQSDETKGEKLELKSTTVVGKMFRATNGDWKEKKTFNSLREALLFLDAKLNIDIMTVTSKAGATTGKTTITLNHTKADVNSYAYTTGADIILPATGDTVSYTVWDGIAEITAKTGDKIVIVEVDNQNKVVCRGITTILTKE